MSQSEQKHQLVLTRTSSAAFGFPLDAKTIELELYLKVSGLPHVVHHTPYPYSTITGALPSVQYGRCVASAAESVRYLARDHCDLSEALTATQRAEAYAFAKLIDDQLPPALAYFLWIDSANYSDVTVEDYACNASFPLRFFLRFAEQRSQRTALETTRVLSVAEAVARVRLCCAALSDKLADGTYFFGSAHPTALDIACAANVALLYAAPLRGGEFRELLHSEFPSLLRHAHALVNTHLNYKVPFDLMRIKRDLSKPQTPSPLSITATGSDSDTGSAGGGAIVASASTPSTTVAGVWKRKTPVAPHPHPIDWDIQKTAEKETAEKLAAERDAAAGGGEAAAKEKLYRTKVLLAGMFASVAVIMLIAKWRRSALGIEGDGVADTPTDTTAAATTAGSRSGSGSRAAAKSATASKGPFKKA